MRISVTDAKGQTDRIGRRAEAGDEVVLTRRSLLALLRHPTGRILHRYRYAGSRPAPR
jgi:hypothetical protein